MTNGDAFLAARDFLIAHRTDYEAAAAFAWPVPEVFNWALDYFAVLARGNNRAALMIVNADGHEERVSFAELHERSNRVANFLHRRQVRRGDRLLVMLGNVTELWEVTLAAMKIGAVISPATTLLTRADVEDRIIRGGLTHAIVEPAAAERIGDAPGLRTRIVAGGVVGGWTSYDDGYAMPAHFEPLGQTRADDPFLLYFTSGTTARPKMVLHTHASYPVGHLSTMYWLGLTEGDVHCNISSPGWAKHAWSSLFAPWNAGATVFVHNRPRFEPQRMLEALHRYGITSLCAPPTVWRLMIVHDLGTRPGALRELASAGEPLNPEVIQRVQAAWNITVRDGYGQTETTALVGNSPGQAVKPGSMGRPMPGYRILLVNDDGEPASEGQLAVALRPRPAGLMAGYAGDADARANAAAPDHYLTGDVASRDADGYYWYVGRADDVFKSSDYRISPFELESALIEHEAVAEAAIVPSPDPIRLTVPKAYVVLVPSAAPTRETALTIFRFARERLAPYKRIRRIEFADLPKTISGKIRRVELRDRERELRGQGDRGPSEFWEDDFPELKR